MVISSVLIRDTVPNIIFETEGEPDIASRLSTWLTQAEIRLRANVLGDTDQWIDGKTECLVQSRIILEAVADALPALDLVMTPTGLAVASSSELAPASKDRTIALRKELYAASDRALAALVDMLLASDWAGSTQASRFSASTISHPKRAVKLKQCQGLRLMDAVDRANLAASPIERHLQEHYLGETFISACRRYLADGSLDADVSSPDKIRLAASMLSDNMIMLIDSLIPNRAPSDIQMYRAASLPLHLAMQSDSMRRHILDETPSCQSFDNEMQGALYL